MRPPRPAVVGLTTGRKTHITLSKTGRGNGSVQRHQDLAEIRAMFTLQSIFLTNAREKVILSRHAIAGHNLGRQEGYR